MKYPLLFHAAYCEPLCIDPSVFRAVHTVLWPRIATGQGMDIEAASGTGPKQGGDPYNGRRASQASPSVDGYGRITDDRFYSTVPGRDDVAVVPIYGMLAKNAGYIQEACMGITDVNRISHAIHQAAAAPEISTLILDLATPGGQVTGIPELATLIGTVSRGYGMTTYAFCDERVCSAGYWLASQAEEIYVTPSATVGSIGTYLAWFDESVKMQMEGLRLEFFGEGKHKGMGLPGKPLTQEDRELLQNRVAEINGWFMSAVTTARSGVSEVTMQGQTFCGAEAVERGLVDGLVSSWEEFVSLI